MASLETGDCAGKTVTAGDSTFEISDLIGSGAQGSVYATADREGQVLKIFNHEQRQTKRAKIRAMISNDPNHERIVWPETIVEDPQTDEFLGYLMSRIDLDSASNAFEYTMTRLDWDCSERDHRFAVCQNLAAMVDAIHDEGHAVGDFNHDNILINEQREVSLIDCDGFHVTGQRESYPDETYYPRYAPPEGRGGNTLSNVQEADRFCLGVHIFQFLMEGFHPYHAQGSEAVNGSMEDKLNGNKFPYVDYAGYGPIDSAPGVDAYENAVPHSVRDLFRRCFTESGKNQSEGGVLDHANPDRPDPREWISAIPLSYSDKRRSDTADGSELNVVTPDDSGQHSGGGDSSLDPVRPSSGDTPTDQSKNISPVSPTQDDGSDTDTELSDEKDT